MGLEGRRMRGGRIRAAGCWRQAASHGWAGVRKQDSVLQLNVATTTAAIATTVVPLLNPAAVATTMVPLLNPAAVATTMVTTTESCCFCYYYGYDY